MYSKESEEWMIRASNYNDYIAQVLVCSHIYRELHQIYVTIVNGINRAIRMRIINPIDISHITEVEHMSFEICHHWCSFYLRTLEWHNHMRYDEQVNIDIRTRNADINTWLNRKKSFDEFVVRNNRMPDSYPNGFSYPEEVINYFNKML